MSEIVLVVAAHPDDEVLGCGATMARHVARGDSVHVLILAEGITSRRDSRSRADDLQVLHGLRESAQRANAALGVHSLELGDLPDNRMDGVELLTIVKRIERALAQHAPTIVYTHHAGDLNVDHAIAQQAVVTATRPQPGSSVCKVLFFEVPSSTEWQVPSGGVPFAPNWFVDVSDHLEQKKAALEEYASEMRAWPHARSIRAVEHLARWRGASIGVEAAEAFVTGRCVER